MLADNTIPFAQSGTFAKDVHLPGTSRHRLLDFIADQLPSWRDNPDRPANITSETQLSEHLCDYLTGAARISGDFDCFQFRTETSDEEKKARKIDLAIKPCGVALWIEGRRHTQFEAIMPIECKRLPTPDDKARDEREYVVVQNGTTGGIQRFKLGHHGGAHEIAAMIGYIQSEVGDYWQKQIAKWIQELAADSSTPWSSSDLLRCVVLDSPAKLSRLVSNHSRTGGKAPIELHHLWIQMN